jgi:UDP-N-acetylmuramoyl-tripeptide--D-alanyl-D-alanine ligase
VTALWTAEAVAAATGGSARGDWVASGVSIDTRTLARGDLFVALVGPNNDAHAFVGQALDRGAVAAVVSRAPEGNVDPAGLVVVGDTQAALEALGRAGRDRTQARVAGITGSVGKTGTKEALRHVLSCQAPTHASAASYNNHWGVPLSLARAPEDASYGVFELGMNHAGEIRGLVAQVRPHVALITAIAPAHLEFFPSVEAIADAKSEIFEGLEPGGVAVVNRDGEHHDRIRAHAERSRAGRVVTFGRHPAADWRLWELRLGTEASEVVAVHAGGRLAYRVGMPGEHVALNSLGVLAVVEALGADVAQAAGSLVDLQTLAGRGERRSIAVGDDGQALLIDESYNASPASMRAALALLGQMPGRRVAVLGDMLELGEQAGQLHAALAASVEEAGVERVFTCGCHMAWLQDALPAARRGAHATDSASLAAAVADALRPGDAVLVKGSLGSRMKRVVDALVPAGTPSGSRAER